VGMSESTLDISRTFL